MSDELFPEGSFDSLALGLEYLERHFFTRYIFPIRPGKKFPPLVPDNLDGNCSNDPERIKRWSKRFPGCNWGVAHRKSGLMVIDVDSNQAKGKVGRDTFDALAIAYDWPDTEMTTTPSGGFHLVYEGWSDDRHDAHIMALGINGLGRDIDAPNYTLIAGCQLVDGTSYVGNDGDAVRCPEWVYDVILTAKQRKGSLGADAGEIVVELDQQGNIDTAIDFLQFDAEPAIQGQGGDGCTFRAACYLKDIGISIEYGAELMNEYYNPRCIPQWDRSDLVKKMKGAYAYGSKSKVGGKTAEADFGDDPIEDFKPIGDPEKIEVATRQRTAKGRARAITKIRKLRAVTNERGAAANEVAKAQNSVLRLIALYSLTEDEIANSSIAEGSSDEWYDIKGRYVYVGRDERFVDTTTGESWKVTAFDKFYASVRVGGKDTGGRLSQYIFLNQLVPMCKSVVYMPGGDKMINGNLNNWLPSDIVPRQGDTSRWNAHMAYLFPDLVIRDHVLNWLAWVYQNPGSHPKHALFVHGEVQGTGKSFIAHVLARVMGRPKGKGYTGSKLIDAKTLEADHNGWELETKLAYVEEVRPGFGSSQAVLKKLHPLVTQDTIPIDRKGQDPEEIANYLALMLFSNKDDALAIDNTDRRYLIVSVDMNGKLEKRSDAYYVALYDLLKEADAMAAIAFELASRDLKGYSGLAAAPATEAKARMVEETRDDLELWFDEHRASFPLNCQLTTLDEIMEHIPNEILHSTRNIRKRLARLVREKLFGESLDKVRLGGRYDPQPRLWRINKETSTPTDRQKYPDKLLSLIYRRERGKLTPEEQANDSKRDAEALREARAEFAVEPVTIQPVDAIDALM
jgi:hypothetical protein